MTREPGELGKDSNRASGVAQMVFDTTCRSPVPTFQASINVPLAIYVHPEDPIIVRVPDGWQPGEDFTAHPTELVMDRRDGSTAIISLDGYRDCLAFHLSTNLDGHHGIELLYWIDCDLVCDAALLDELLDMEVPKRLEVMFRELTERQHGAGTQACQVLESPDVAVIRRNDDKACIQ